MQKKQKGSAEWPFLVVALIVIGLLIIWGVARKHGIDFEVLLRSIGATVLILGLYGGSLYLLRAQYFGAITCAALLVIWPFWFPVLIAMGTNQIPSFGGWGDDLQDIAWYATAWFRWGVELLLIVVGGWTCWSYSRDQW